jgi:predicted nucleotide-binding protein
MTDNAEIVRGKLLEFVEASRTTPPGGMTHERWRGRVLAFLKQAVGEDAADEFNAISRGTLSSATLGMEVGFLEGKLASNDVLTSPTRGRRSSAAAPTEQPSVVRVGARRVFVVHGHDGEAKEATARFLERLGLEPIILHEQPNGGRTIIEKFEVFSSDVAFAVILLTPDDVGAAAENAPLKPRARQNVILELGYFMGRLGRTRVCALHRGDVELPSDYQGILYIPLDPSGAWKTQLAQELVHCKLPINLAALLPDS